MLTYEAQLAADLEMGLREGSTHFDEKNAVHLSLHRIAARLTELQIPYAVVGGMALFSHGVRRFTEDVHILLTAAGLGTSAVGWFGIPAAISGQPATA